MTRAIAAALLLLIGCADAAEPPGPDAQPPENPVIITYSVHALCADGEQPVTEAGEVCADVDEWHAAETAQLDATWQTGSACDVHGGPDGRYLLIYTTGAACTPQQQ